MKTTFLLIRVILPMILIFLANSASGEVVQTGYCTCDQIYQTGTEQKEKDQDLSLPGDSTSVVDVQIQPATSYSDHNSSSNSDFPWFLFIPSTIFADQCPMFNKDLDKRIFYFDSPIRVGDDQNFNENPKHSGMSFCISSAPDHTYTTTFTIPDKCQFTTATLQYWATGVWGDNRIYLNGKLIDTTCLTGNIATQNNVPIQGWDTCCTNGAIDISNVLHIGKNTLSIKLVLYPWDDDGTPYDDIEIYDMHIVVDRPKV